MARIESLKARVERAEIYGVQIVQKNQARTFFGSALYFV